MPVVYFVKDGPRPNNCGPGYYITISDLEKRVGDQDIKYLGEEPPEFNTNNPSWFNLRVVIEVRVNESEGSRFSKIGFYLLPQLTPGVAGPIIFPNGYPPFFIE